MGVLGRSWRALGSLLGALGALLGRSWGDLGRSWGSFGACWALLGALGVLSGHFWVILFWFLLDFYSIFARFLVDLGMILPEAFTLEERPPLIS